MASKHRRSGPGCRDRSGPKKFWQMRSQLTVGRSGLASSVRRRMCGRGGVAGFWKQAMYAKNREWYSGSSSSSGGEEWKSQEQEEIKRLRAQVELLSKRKIPEEPGEPARRGSGLEEGCKMECEEETDYKKKLDEQKKSQERDKSWGNLEDGSFSFCFWGRIG